MLAPPPFITPDPPSHPSVAVLVQVESSILMPHWVGFGGAPFTVEGGVASTPPQPTSVVPVAVGLPLIRTFPTMAGTTWPEPVDCQYACAEPIVEVFQPAAIDVPQVEPLS